MQASDLDYSFPAELIATAPSRPTRVAWVPQTGAPVETDIAGLSAYFRAGDLLVTNETKVLPMRVFALDQAETEVLFLRPLDGADWEVLFPAKAFAVGDVLPLPLGVSLTLFQNGLPQRVRLSRPVEHAYFAQVGEMALPPYIQSARGVRHNRSDDALWYQTDWARVEGSIAAPTASLHFRTGDLQNLKARGVDIASLTLHVGAGTFFPLRVEDLGQHLMHSEEVVIPQATLELIVRTKARGGRVWALGTTVARALESQALHMFAPTAAGDVIGETKLFIYPPFSFRTVDALLTNFHQPKSTLLGLVAAFAGLERVREVYTWAIERRFHLFSYGDLSAWIKP